MNLLEITEFSLWSQKWNLIWSGWIISPICLAIIYRRIDPKWMTESNSWNLPWLHFHISRSIKCLWCARALTQLAKSSRWWRGSRGDLFWKYKKIWFSRKVQQNSVTSPSPDSPVWSSCLICTRWIPLKKFFATKKSSFGISFLTGAWHKSLA